MWGDWRLVRKMTRQNFARTVWQEKYPKPQECLTSNLKLFSFVCYKIPCFLKLSKLYHKCNYFVLSLENPSKVWISIMGQCKEKKRMALKDEMQLRLIVYLKHLPAMWETRVRSLGQEDPLEKEMATHYKILAWRIPWTEESGGLQSTGSQRVGHDWAT